MRRRSISEDQMSGSQGHFWGNLQVFALKVEVIVNPTLYEYYFSVFKGSIVGKWLEYASTFSNMNIFSSVLTSEKMMEKTSPTAMEDDCVGAGDYLR